MQKAMAHAIRNVCPARAGAFAQHVVYKSDSALVASLEVKRRVERGVLRCDGARSWQSCCARTAPKSRRRSHGARCTRRSAPTLWRAWTRTAVRSLCPPRKRLSCAILRCCSMHFEICSLCSFLLLGVENRLIESDIFAHAQTWKESEISTMAPGVFVPELCQAVSV